MLCQPGGSGQRQPEYCSVSGAAGSPQGGAEWPPRARRDSSPGGALAFPCPLLQGQHLYSLWSADVCLEPESQGREMSLWSLGLLCTGCTRAVPEGTALRVSGRPPARSASPWTPFTRTLANPHTFAPNCCLCSEACPLGTLRPSSPFSGRLAGLVWLLEPPHKCRLALPRLPHECG